MTENEIKKILNVGVLLSAVVGKINLDWRE